MDVVPLINSTLVPLTESHRRLLSECSIHVGDRVVTNNVEGEVKYIGPLKYKGKLSPSLYVGIQLDEPNGKHSGTLEGLRYFTAPPNQGVFKPLTRVRKIEPPMAASGADITKLMQHVSNETTKEQELFRMWNAMDRLEESEALTTSKELDLMGQEIDRQYTESMSLKSDKEGSGEFEWGQRQPSMTIESVLLEPVHSKYKGPHLIGQADGQFANSLFEYFIFHIDKVLPKKYAMTLLLQVETLLKEQIVKSVYRFEIPKKPDAQLILVGDVHGQINDVAWIFYKFGTPSPTRTYLFNGDIADRGRYAVEIFFLLFAFKVAYPDSVIVNRGNHESPEMNEVYGFAHEVRSKYGSVFFTKFQDIFNLLSLCVVVEKRVFITHGGLFYRDNVKLAELEELYRHRPCPCDPNSDEDRLMFDLLWSDPRDEEGRGPSGRGATCVSFGPDVTEEFLSNNQLDVCIRSHQVPSTLRGFEPVHAGRCVTLFSASNYCGTSGNYGGVIIFDPSLVFEIQEYMAPAMSEIQEVFNSTKMALVKVTAETELVKAAERKAASRSRRSSISNMESDVLFKMCRLICENKDAIWQKVTEKDSSMKGTLPSKEFEQCLNSSVIHFDGAIPWSLLFEKINAVDSQGRVEYQIFLNRFRVEFRPKSAKHVNWRLETVQQVYESIMKADLNLRELLMIFDRNSDGTVTYRDFYELLNELKLGLSEPQVRLLMRILTAQYSVSTNDVRCNPDGGARIDIAEFLGRFKVIYNVATKEETSDVNSLWIKKALEALGRVILADKREAAERYYQETEQYTALPPRSERRRSSALQSAALFQKFREFGDVEQSGFLSYENFIAAVRKLPLASVEKELGFPLTGDKLNELVHAIDVTGSGSINYLEFLNAFHVVDSSTTANLAEQMWQQLCAKFYQQKVSLRVALTRFDPEATGKVAPEDFRSALLTLNTVLGSSQAPLTTNQVDLVVNSIDLENGMINYDEFLDAFVVVDFLQLKSESRRFSADTASTVELEAGAVSSLLSDSSSDDEGMDSDVESHMHEIFCKVISQSDESSDEAPHPRLGNRIEFRYLSGA